MTLDVRLVADGGLAAETDPNSHLSATASTVSYAGLINTEQAWYYIDYGADYFSGNASVEYGLHVTSTVTPAGNTAHLHVGFSQLATYGIDTTNYEASTIFIVSPTSSTLMQTQSAQRRTTTETVVNAGTVTKTNQYYARTSLLSSLGQYGGINSQLYSDSSRATLVVSATVARLTAADNYRYLMLAQGRYTTGTASITGDNSDFNLTAPTAGIDLTAGTETDASARLAPYADCIVVTALSVNSADNAATHIAIDEGAGFFDEYTVSGVLNITAFGGSGALMQYFEILTVCDAAASSDALNDSQGIAVYWVSATTYKLYIHQAVGGADTFSTASATYNINQPVSITLNRSGTTLTMKVWNDLVLDTSFAGTSLAETVTWTGREATTYRYLLPVTSYLSGATTRSATFTLGGVKRIGNPSTASYTSDGGFIIGGSATNSRSAYATGSGGILLGGSATHSRSTAYIATGGFIIGGSADFSANGAQSVSYTSAGGFIIGGTATNSRSSSHTGSGGFRLGGSAAYSFTLQTNVQEIVFELYDSTGAPITGATTITCKLRTTPGAQIYDWSDDTFKSSGWTTISTDLNEIDATNLPGVYKKEIDVSNFADGRYQVFITYSATQSQHGSIEFLVDDGQMVDEYTATNTHTALIDIANTLTVGEFLALK